MQIHFWILPSEKENYRMITLSFYTPEERKPRHGEEIIVITDRGGLDFEYFQPQTRNVEYYWKEYDVIGKPTGNESGYDPDTESEYGLGDSMTEEPGYYHKLQWSAEVYTSESILYWVPAEEFWDSFSKK